MLRELLALLVTPPNVASDAAKTVRGLNWRRGLFRLWLVGSLAWIGLSFLEYRPDQDLQQYLSAATTRDSWALLPRQSDLASRFDNNPSGLTDDELNELKRLTVAFLAADQNERRKVDAQINESRALAEAIKRGIVPRETLNLERFARALAAADAAGDVDTARTIAQAIRERQHLPGWTISPSTSQGKSRDIFDRAMSEAAKKVTQVRLSQDRQR